MLLLGVSLVEVLLVFSISGHGCEAFVAQTYLCGFISFRQLVGRGRKGGLTNARRVRSGEREK